MVQLFQILSFSVPSFHKIWLHDKARLDIGFSEHASPNNPQFYIQLLYGPHFGTYIYVCYSLFINFRQFVKRLACL